MMDQLEQLVKTRPDEKVGIYTDCPLINVTNDTADPHCLSVDGLPVLGFQLPVLGFQLPDREGNTPCQVRPNFSFLLLALTLMSGIKVT